MSRFVTRARIYNERCISSTENATHVILTTFPERLKAIFPGLTVAEIARKLEIPHATVRNYFNGRLPATDILIKLADETSVSLTWLLTGKGPEWASATISQVEPGQVPVYFGAYEQQVIRDLASESGRTFEEEVRGMVLEELTKRGLVGSDEPSNVVFYGEPIRTVELPLMGWIAAGEPLHLVAEEQMVRVPDFMMKRGKQHFVLHVRGDSMVEDHIPDDSLIICEQRQTAVDGERVVAVIEGDKVTVKRIYHEGDRIRLQPANPLHKPIYLEQDQKLEIQGVVVAVFHK